MASFFFPPPPPFMGGHQPHQGRVTFPQLGIPRNDPPFSHPGRLPQNVVIGFISLGAWAVNPYVYAPPGGRQPYDFVRLPPQITAVPVNNPPFTLQSQIATAEVINLANQPPPPNAFMGGRQPLEPRKLPPSITAVPVNNPPIRRNFNFDTIHAAWRTPDAFLGASRTIQAAPFYPRNVTYIVVIT